MFVENKSTQAGRCLIMFRDKFYLSFISLLDCNMTNFIKLLGHSPPPHLPPVLFHWPVIFILPQIYKIAACPLPSYFPLWFPEGRVLSLPPLNQTRYRSLKPNRTHTSPLWPCGQASRLLRWGFTGSGVRWVSALCRLCVCGTQSQHMAPVISLPCFPQSLHWLRSQYNVGED